MKYVISLISDNCFYNSDTITVLVSVIRGAFNKRDQCKHCGREAALVNRQIPASPSFFLNIEHDQDLNMRYYEDDANVLKVLIVEDPFGWCAFGGVLTHKNEPSRFLGEGMTFKAKLIGILQVNEARGDKMCQDALNDLKTAIRAAGEHKQRITISIAIDGLRLRDEKTGDCLYHHPVHKISFIAQDMSDSRAFGYIFGSPDTGHRFFGIKTDKTASQVVISMRDLFQVVFELKKKEIEMAKHHIEQRQIKYSTTVNTDSLYPLKDDYDADKGKGKYPQLIKIRSVTSKSSESTGASAKAGTSEAIADLLDLEHELNSIQQGINQMERITPSDPFGPLGRGDPFLDPFEDSFSSKVENISEVKVPPPVSTKTLPSKPKTPSQSCSVESPIEIEKQSKLFEGANQPASKPNFFPQFSPVAKAEEAHWFDQETESLFNDRTNVSNTEPTSSPITFPVQEKFDPNQVPEEKKSPVKPDVFMELDPLGSGWVKPYVDKKDFFQDLKNPPKKVLKELLTDNYSNDNAHQLLGQLESSKSPQNTSTPNMEQSPKRGTFSKTPSTTLFQSPKEAGTNGSKYSKIDPFDDTDPFEKADPFSEKHFSSELPSLFTDKSFDGVFPEASTFDTATKEEDSPFSSSSIHGPLRVSLPPEKPDTNTPISLSSITSKFRNSPSPPESLRRKNYQVLKQSTDEKGDDNSRSPVQDEFFCSKVTSTYSPKTLGRKSFSSKSKFWNEEQEGSPNPSPKPALFSIKPPPLPPKKQPQFKPPARPPSLEEKSSHYDTLREEPSPFQEPRSPNKKSKRTGERSNFPLLPPPPQRKTQPEKNSEQKPAKEGAKEGSILNITLNQLDNTGLENLAVTLGIPSSHIYNMTLQELTKRLSVKYLKTEAKQSETFEADFESNFGKAETTNAPTYDKYAVFKELIENENKRVNGNINEKEESESNENSKQVEDRYAALRQLSVVPQKSENLSEDLDFSVEEDSSNRADNLSDNVRPKTADSLTPMNSVELATDSPIVVEKEDKEDEESVKAGIAEAPKSAEVQNESPFAGKEQEDKRDNWATFDKLSLYELPAQPETFNDNDNSPFSSDGKEESFTWRKKTRQRMRNEVPWHDEDESWDDYSPKESYWSDESSHDDRSPDKRREGKYQRKTWSKQIRKMKGDQWCRRPKWNDDTEDEYEESWKNHRCRIGICDKDRKSEVCPINNWCNNKNELWVDSDRYMRCCRKKSESDEDYRRRCDSDTSDREYMWTFKRGFPEGYTPSEKQKPYYMLSRDYPERCHEPRSKHRKGESHKRPSSASESKRNYEQIGDHIVKGKRGLTEDDQSPSYHKDFRYCCPESLHHYNSYDRRQQVQCKKSARSRKNEVEQYGMESKEKKSDSFDYYKSTWHKDEGRRNRHYQFEDDFAPATPEKTLPRLESPKRDSSRSPRRRQRQVNSKDGYFRSDNNNESFDSFGAEFRSPETNKPQEEPEREREKERGQPSKQQIFGKNHFAMLTRQESSTSLRKSESINIFSRDNDPFEGDDFFSTAPPANHKLNKFTSEKSKSNSNVSDTFTWKEVFGESSFHD